MNTYICIYTVTHISPQYLCIMCVILTERSDDRWKFILHCPEDSSLYHGLPGEHESSVFTSTHLQGSLLGRWGGVYYVDDGILLAVFLNACYLIFLVNHFVDLSQMSWANPTVKMLKSLCNCYKYYSNHVIILKPQPSQINDK